MDLTLAWLALLVTVISNSVQLVISIITFIRSERRHRKDQLQKKRARDFQNLEEPNDIYC
jgi:hypothetical protein